MAQAARIFVSHAHADSAWCRAFVQVLRDAGADVWYDEHDLTYAFIGEEIVHELQVRPTFIVLHSPASLASPWVQREVGTAIGLGEKDRTRSILLVTAEQADVPTLWAAFQRVSGPGDRGLSAPEAGRRVISILAHAPAHTPGTSAVSAIRVADRKVTEYRSRLSAPIRDTWGPLAILLLVAASVGFLALLWYPSTQVQSIFPNVSNNLDALVGTAPQGITLGPDGALWFTESQGSSRIGRITTSGELSEFSIPSGSQALDGITTGPDRALWFTESGSQIGRITTDGQVREFPLPPGSSSAKGITTGPDGALWFTEPQSNRIGRIITSGQVSEFPASGAPEEITTGPDGALWFTASAGNAIGRITISGQLREFSLPSAGGGPGGITTGPDGALWFTESRGQIGRITTRGQVREYVLHTPVSTPMRITTGPDGALWFTEFEANSIGCITTSGDLQEVYVHSPPGWPTNALPWGITKGPDGALWFTEYYGNAIGRFTTSGQLSAFSLPTPIPTPTPVGASSNVP